MAAEDGQEMLMSAVNSADQCPAVRVSTRHHGGSTVQPKEIDTQQLWNRVAQHHGLANGTKRTQNFGWVNRQAILCVWNMHFVCGMQIGSSPESGRGTSEHWECMLIVLLIQLVIRIVMSDVEIHHIQSIY